MLHNYVLFAHLLSTAIMLGIIWFVQVIHYPLFAIVDDGNFLKYEKEHVRRTKFLIMPAMLIELATAALLVMTMSSSQTVFWLNLLALGLIWSSTFFVQVPLHGRLLSEKNNINIKRLVHSNWIRTVLWSGRMILLIWIIVFEI